MKYKQRVIITDGPDRSGKTEIAKALSEEFDIPYFKLNDKKFNTEYDLWKNNKFKLSLEFDQTYSCQFLKQTGHSVIIDRAYPSEWVYSKVYNRETNNDILSAIDNVFSNLNTVILIPLRREYSHCKDELVKTEELKMIHDKYIEFTKWTKCNTIIMYVDDFDSSLKKQIPVLKKNLIFSTDKALRYNKVLEKK